MPYSGSAVECLRILLSYLHAQVVPYPNEDNFKQWVSNRFGRRLYEIFFRGYTEKVWGVPCTQIGAEWAAQRIKSLSLGTALRNSVFGNQNTRIKSFVQQFHYPDRGPGQMWETLAQAWRKWLSDADGFPSVRICHQNGKATHLIMKTPRGVERLSGTDFISSMPMRELIEALDPVPPDEVQRAGTSLHYRDFLIVSLIVNRKHVMSDNWIYIHDSAVAVGRIQNFKNWSPAMVPDPEKTCLGMEYFVSENDTLWNHTDDALVELAKEELVCLGLARPDEVEDGTVMRMLKAYPMYDNGWADSVRTIRAYLEKHLTNLQLIGRNGMHKYNNQDHSMMTALVCGAKYSRGPL